MSETVATFFHGVLLFMVNNWCGFNSLHTEKNQLAYLFLNTDDIGGSLRVDTRWTGPEILEMYNL